MISGEKSIYHPKDAIMAGLSGAGMAGAAGAMIAGVQNSLSKSNVGAWGIVSRFGGTMALFTAVGASYEFVTTASANLREQDDSLNPVLGGFVSGSLIGLKAGTTPAVLGYGAVAAVLMGAFDYTGGRLTGPRRDPELDEFERKQIIRKHLPRPIEATIAEIGEGRGIYAPGYEERRRARLKEKYGIEVPVKS
ncbi:BgTH12-02712 [Blumeria graminis f. sp. triticale]|uniref:BgtA-20821 n=3 Tax=Blumeria graminis TaxID=34373 RepID=A0A9X9MIH9_BLUGR|nr:hypothetical protein BGT96224_A20821 [Blumeria graminis f. sp. tritici 96224]CAD6503041.1 BgTH12-02712 [Blumeria graminis f. sp. triticale]VDB88978.1 BgtA-20821 [Blumeria graminis f. sp. tritici]